MYFDIPRMEKQYTFFIQSLTKDDISGLRHINNMVKLLSINNHFKYMSMLIITLFHIYQNNLNEDIGSTKNVSNAIQYIIENTKKELVFRRACLSLDNINNWYSWSDIHEINTSGEHDIDGLSTYVYQNIECDLSDDYEYDLESVGEGISDIVNSYFTGFRNELIFDVIFELYGFVHVSKFIQDIERLNVSKYKPIFSNIKIY